MSSYNDSVSLGYESDDFDNLFDTEFHSDIESDNDDVDLNVNLSGVSGSSSNISHHAVAGTSSVSASGRSPLDESASAEDDTNASNIADTTSGQSTDGHGNTRSVTIKRKLSDERRNLKKNII